MKDLTQEAYSAGLQCEISNIKWLQKNIFVKMFAVKYQCLKIKVIQSRTINICTLIRDSLRLFLAPLLHSLLTFAPKESIN